MNAGYVPDFAHSCALVSSWHEGEPMKTFLFGLHVSQKKGIPIRAYRCSACGFLEFYAERVAERVEG